MRNAMPPPPTHASTPGGGIAPAHLCVCAAERTHCIVQRHRHRTQAQEHGMYSSDTAEEEAPEAD